MKSQTKQMMQFVSLGCNLHFHLLGEKIEPFEDGLEVKILKSLVNFKLNLLTGLLSNQNTANRRRGSAETKVPSLQKIKGTQHLQLQISSEYHDCQYM